MEWKVMTIKQLKKHKGLCLILIIMILSITIGNIILKILGLHLKDINATIEIQYLILFQLIQIIFLSLFEFIDEEFSLKDIRRSVIICLVIYFIPFSFKWKMNQNIILKSIEERFGDIYRLSLNFIESDDLIISLRYVMILLICTLFLFYIKNSIKINRDIKSVVLRWIVCFLLCISVSYTYLDREKLMKNERWSIVQDTALIMEYLSAVTYDIDIEDTENTLNTTEKLLLESELSKSTCNLEQQIIDAIRVLTKGEGWKTFYEKEKSYKFIGLEAKGYEIEEGVKQLEQYMQLNEEERLLLVQALTNDILEDYKLFIINKGVSDYFGLWTPAQFEEEMNEWLYNQEKIIRHKYMLFY